MAADWLDREMEIWHNLAHLAEDAIEDIMIQDAQEQLRQNEIMGHYLYAENENNQRAIENLYANAESDQARERLSQGSLQAADMMKESTKMVINQDERYFTDNNMIMNFDNDYEGLAAMQEDMEYRHGNPEDYDWRRETQDDWGA